MSVPDKIYTANSSYRTDCCATETRELQNNAINSYELFDSQLVPCNSKTAMRSPEYQYEHVNLRAGIGYGLSDSCTIDQYSHLRNDPNQLTRDKCRMQLYTRVFFDGPNLRPGVIDSDQELGLIEGGYSSSQRDGVDFQCKRSLYVDGVARMTPMLDCIKKDVQNPKNIIPTWINGGEPTRDFVRRQEFLESCGYQNQGRNVKSTY